jgi:hypothetical protein
VLEHIYGTSIDRKDQLGIDDIGAHQPGDILDRILLRPHSMDTAVDHSARRLDLTAAISDGPAQVGTNALLERQGAKHALLITRGFKDLLAIGNQARRAPSPGSASAP